jgi:murein hydrolase activator
LSFKPNLLFQNPGFELVTSRAASSATLRATSILQLKPSVVGSLVVLGLATVGLFAHDAMAQQVMAQAANPAATKKLSPEEARNQLEANKHQLDEVKRRTKELQTDMSRLGDERKQINTRLIEMGELIKQSEAQLTTTEQRIGELEAQEVIIRGSLEQKHGSIATLLAAMQRMGRNPPPVMVTRPEDALSMVRSAMLLSFTFPEMRTQALALADQLNELVRVMTTIRGEADKLRTETARLADARTNLATLMETKRQSLGERQEELAQVRKAASEISRSVTDLNELIGRLDKAVAEKTRLGAYEKQLEADAAKQAAQSAAGQSATGQSATGQSAAVPSTAAPSPSADGPAVAVSPPKANDDVASAITLAPSNDRMALLSPGRIQPAMPFQSAKGRLPLPAQGRRVLSFGEKTQTSRSQGIVIETRHGAQITAPNDGWVMYAGEFRSYGQILIINGGGGYNVLLAGLSQVDVQVGQFVLAGEPIGTMTQQAKGSKPKTGDNAPVLYVEFRKDQRPIDPDPWWADSTRKVQG